MLTMSLAGPGADIRLDSAQKGKAAVVRLPLRSRSPPMIT